MDDIRPAIPSNPIKLLDQIRRHMRDGGYAWKTEKTYIHWIRRFILFHRKQHPASMSAGHIDQFLSNLANERCCMDREYGSTNCCHCVSRISTLKCLPSPFAPAKVTRIARPFCHSSSNHNFRNRFHWSINCIDVIWKTALVRSTYLTHWPDVSLASSNTLNATPFATVSPRAFCSRVPTYARYRSYLATVMSPPRKSTRMYWGEVLEPAPLYRAWA